MARFVYTNGQNFSGVSIEADDGEELPVDMVAAWAAMKQAYALSEIASNIIGLDNAISSVANEIAGK